ncbi:hypothetical protein ACFWH7_20720 [Cellulosimicrobium cellulans]|uniref:hypothetical protein n=1 Tax=Cellulosimicrobium cellulans TaxID=1710 RepID=UPI0036468390
MSSTTTAAPAATTSPTSTRRLTAAALVAAGAGFVLFPVLRPWPDEAHPTAELAAAFASDRWVVAHLCGILAIGLLAPALLGLRSTVAARASRRTTDLLASATGLVWAGGFLAALFFGAEMFGIQAIARSATGPAATGFLDVVTDLRTGSLAVTLFGAGLTLLAAGGLLTAIALRRVARWWFTLPFALGLFLLLPQFWGGPGLRVAHGVMLGAGCALLAVVVLRRPRP